MDHKSFWHGDTHAPQLPALSQDIHTETLIIGGGMTGMTAAYRLHRGGRPFVLIEARHIGAGDSGHTTAHLTNSFDTRYSKLESMWNEKTAAAVARAMTEAIDFIEETSRQENIDCHFQRVPGYLYAETDEQEQTVRDEYDAARRHGVDVTLVNETPLPFPVRKAVRFNRNARFHPLHYLYGLARNLQAQGARLFADTWAVSLKVEDGRVQVQTGRGPTVTADNVIIATHIPTWQKAMQSALPAYRTYAVAYEVEGDVPEGLFWDLYDPYRYTRPARHGDRLVLVTGGADHRTGKEVDTEGQFTQLEEYVRERFPVRDFLNRWSGQYYIPTDKIPVISRGLSHDNVFFSTGYLGDGMTFGTFGGKLLADTILGHESEMLEIFDHKRLNLTSVVTDYVPNNADVVFHFVKDRLSWDTTDVEDIAPGEGKIVRKGIHQYAVYHQPEGGYIALSPVCTHLGCIVNWNPAEKTWDCPCHGSQFAATGEPLRAPAVKGLERRSIEVTEEQENR